MTKEEYNRICLPYQFLTKRFDINQIYTRDGYYKCYNPEYYIVRGEHLKTLKKFENLTLRDIHTDEHLDLHHYSSEYLDSKLTVIEEKRVCVFDDLGQIFFYLTVHKLENGIKQFIELIGQLQAEYKRFVKSKEEGRVIVIGMYFFEDLKYKFEQIENYDKVFHLLGKTNSGFLMQDWNNNIEIHMNRINGILKTLKSYDFSKVEL